MAMTALVFWIFTAFGGAYMWLRVNRFGRSSAEIRHTRLPDIVLLVHPSAALAGLAAWVGYLVTDEKWLAWVGFGALVAASSGGIVMLLKTLQPDETVQVTRDDPGEAPYVAQVTYAEHELPRPVIAGHGVLAAVTIVLVLLEALLG